MNIEAFKKAVKNALEVNEPDTKVLVDLTTLEAVVNHIEQLDELVKFKDKRLRNCKKNVSLDLYV